MRRIVLLLLLTTLIGACRRGRAKATRGPPPTVLPSDDPKTPEGRARNLVQQLHARHYGAVRASFGPNLSAVLTEPALIAAWTGTLARAGRFERIDTVTVDPQKDGLRVAHVHTDHLLIGVDVRVIFDADDHVAGLWFDPRPGPWVAPAYVQPSAFVDRPAEVAGLPGTLTIPKGLAQPAPGVLLVHDSGPNDRDETVGGRKPLRDLAEGLATRGIVVLRWDKRSKAAPDTLKIPFDLDAEVTRDARAAIDLLVRTKEVDPKRITLIGHGQGAGLSPRIAAQDPRLAGLVLLAGDSRRFEELMVDQSRYLLGLDGLTGVALDERLAAIRKECVVARDPKGDPAELLSVGGSKAPRQYWQDLLAYDPTTPAKTLTLPMLVVQGGRDYQVTSQDFDGWTKALAGHKRVVFRFHPPLDHHLVIGEGPSRPDDYRWPGHVAGEVVADIVAFVVGTLGS